MMTLTKEQKSAVKSVEKAFRKCKDTGVYFHNCYGILIAYPGDIVSNVDDVCPDGTIEIDCQSGRALSIPYYMVSWADDTHFVHLTKKGKKLAGAEEGSV